MSFLLGDIQQLRVHVKQKQPHGSSFVYNSHSRLAGRFHIRECEVIYTGRSPRLLFLKFDRLTLKRLTIGVSVDVQFLT
jgi:hypothetical protein